MSNTYVSKLVDDVMTAAYAHWRKDTFNFLETIPELHGKEYFKYKGSSYSKSTGTKVIAAAGLSSMLPNLPYKHVFRFQEQLNKRKVLDGDAKALSAIFTNVVEGCKTEEDLRNALPDIVVPEELKLKYPRTKEAAFTIISNDLQYRQYMKYMDKLYLYASYRLLG